MKSKRKPISEIAVEKGYRLSQVIDVYYGKQTRFAELSGYTLSRTNNFVHGYEEINQNVAIKLQQTLGINSRFLLFGEEPMMVDPEAKPNKDYEVKFPVKPIITKGELLKQYREDLSTNQGIIAHAIMSREGIKSEISNQGTISVIGITINGLKEVQGIQVIDPVFVNAYKEKYNITTNCSLIVSNIFNDADGVLIKVGREHRIAVFDDEKFYDVLTKEEIINATSEDVVGRIYKIINNFEINWS